MLDRAARARRRAGAGNGQMSAGAGVVEDDAVDRIGRRRVVARGNVVEREVVRADRGVDDIECDAAGRVLAAAGDTVVNVAPPAARLTLVRSSAAPPVALIELLAPTVSVDWFGLATPAPFSP